MRQQLVEFIAVNKPSVHDPSVLWDVVKGFSRDETVGFSSNLHKSKLRHIHELEKKIAETESCIALNPIPGLVHKRELLNKELHQSLRLRVDFLIDKTRQNHYLYSGQLSLLLASKLLYCMLFYSTLCLQ